MVTVGYNPSTGKALWGTGGKLCIGCCTAGGNPTGDTCSNCGINPTPLYLTINFSGITDENSVCYNASVGGDLMWTGVPTLNGDYILEQMSSISTCLWHYCESISTVTQTIYNSTGGTCDGGVASTNTYDYLSISAIRYASDIYVRACLAPGCASVTSVITQALFWHMSGETPSSGCMNTGSISSTLTQNTGFPAYGGSATITEGY